MYFPLEQIQKERKINGYPIIFCLGDSFTQGVGTTSHFSYPAQLETIMKPDYPGCKVINLGIGGMNSALVLKKVEESISTYQPEVIIIMVGANNFWNHEGVQYTNSDLQHFVGQMDSFLGSLRTYKLFKIVFLSLSPRADLPQKMYARDEMRSNVLSRVNKRSVDLTLEAEVAVGKGNYRFAQTAFDEAYRQDQDNYFALLMLARLNMDLLSNEDRQRRSNLATEKGMFWQAIQKIKKDEWQKAGYVLIGDFIMMGEKEGNYKELEKLMLYFRNKQDPVFYRPIQIVSKSLETLKKKELQDQMLICDLKEMTKIARKKQIHVVFETYPERWPSNPVNKIIRNVAEQESVTLVDNELFFKDKLDPRSRSKCFVADGHCSAEGYRCIAENTYKVLSGKKIIKKNEGKKVFYK